MITRDGETWTYLIVNVSWTHLIRRSWRRGARRRGYDWRVYPREVMIGRTPRLPVSRSCLQISSVLRISRKALTCSGTTILLGLLLGLGAVVLAPAPTPATPAELTLATLIRSTSSASPFVSVE
jgi:hypothetical protein